jgi:predicted O-methyltransferase YrrM
MAEALQFCPALVRLTEAVEATGRSGRTRKVSAVSSLNNLVVLRNLFTRLQPKRTLEIGCAFGASAMLFTACHREAGHPPSAQHTAIDPFQASVWDECGLMALEHEGLRDYLDFRPDFSSAALPKLVAEGRTYDVIYIDGSHLFEDVFVDFYFAAQLLNKDGIVLFDDSADPHVKKVLHFIRSNYAFAFTGLDLSEYRADRGATLRYRVAKALGKTQLTAFKKTADATREWNAAFKNF